MTSPMPDRTLPAGRPGAPELATLRLEFGSELARLGYPPGPVADRLLIALLGRGWLRRDMDPIVFRRYARRCVDAWLKHAVARLELPFAVGFNTRLAALQAVNLGRWPEVLLAAELPEDFLAELRAALPLAAPPDAPLPMPVQDLGSVPPLAAPAGVRHWRYAWRRAAILGATLGVTGGAIAALAKVFAPGGLTTIEYALILLFAINFGWICLSFWSALAGLCVLLRRGAPVEQAHMAAWDRPLEARTAVLMPTYNEDPARVFAAVETIYREVDATGELAGFEFFVLSDTTDPDLWIAEEAAWDATRRRLGATGRLFYRRRYANTERKAGNIAGFCRRWGARYDFMLVLDADSVMSGATVVQLARRMAANPQVGIMQTVPGLVNRHSLFARVQQFATALYGPVLASGYAWWFGPDSNYWGHNAMIRVSAFAAHAGMPVLPGKPPFGGHILSHDFIEAALMRRAGWQVWLLPELAGTYEESPPSLLDHAQRDRRWCQGNLQHAAIIGAAGLHPLSRFHLLSGIMSYLASPLWFLFIVTGLAAALQGKLQLPVYFFPERTPYPIWHVMDPELAATLLAVTMSVLLAPKLFGWLAVAASGQRARRYGGRWRLLGSMLGETLFSALSAPAQMLLQSRFVWEVLRGSDSGWKTQARDDRGLAFADCWSRHRHHAMVGLVLAGAAWYVYPGLLAWMLPALLGMVLAAPVTCVGSWVSAGRVARHWGLFLTPEELAPPPVLTRLAATEPVPLPAGTGFEHVFGDPRAAALHLALLEQHPPGELSAPMALARCRVADASMETVATVIDRGLQAAALADRRTVELLLKRLALRANQLG
jgi:membrane glycosyltransferase